MPLDGADDEHRAEGDDHDDGQHLGNAQAVGEEDQVADRDAALEDPEAVRAQTLHIGALDAVEHPVPQKEVARRGVLGLAAVDQQEKEDQEARDRFIEEGRHVPLAQALDVHGVGEELKVGVGDQFAEGLLVEEVAPAADGLPQHQTRRDEIRQRPEGDLFPLREDQRGDDAADDRAVDGDAALPDEQRVDGIGGVLIPLENHIVKAGEDDGRGHGQQGVIEHTIGVQPLALGLAVDHDDRKHHRQGDQNAIPINVVTENGERDGIRAGHIGFLLK